jgi:hypothetical protein
MEEAWRWGIRTDAVDGRSGAARGAWAEVALALPGRVVAVPALPAGAIAERCAGGVCDENICDESSTLTIPAATTTAASIITAVAADHRERRSRTTRTPSPPVTDGVACSWPDTLTGAFPVDQGVGGL